MLTAADRAEGRVPDIERGYTNADRAEGRGLFRVTNADSYLQREKQ